MDPSLDVLEQTTVSLQRYQQMIESLGDVIFTVAGNGYFTYINPRVQKLLGYGPDEVIGKHYTEFVAPTWRERIRSFYNRQRLDCTPETRLEVPVLSASGEEIWIEQIVILTEDGGFQATVHDITQRKLAEQALQKNEQRYRALFEQTNDAVFILDLEGVYVAANKKASDLLGYETDDLIGRSLRQVVSPSEDLQALNVLETLKSGQRVPIYEQLFRTKNGTEFPAEVNVELVRDADGNPIYILSIVRDITERKRAEATIRQSEINLRRNKERVEAILNSSSDAIILVYPDGTLQQANPAFTELFGYQVDELFGKPLEILVKDFFVEALHHSTLAAMDGRQSQRMEVVACRHDGTTFAADIMLSPIISDRSNKPGGIVCSVRDITERKHLEEELRQALEKEKEFSALKTRFVSMASHEFRTPLATIQATCDTLRNYMHKMSPEQIISRFEKIQAQVKHMAIMLDDVLTLGRLQDGRIEFNPVEIEVTELCCEIVDELRGIHGSTHELIYRTPETGVRARLDRKLLRQIVTNLLTNAVKYSPQGSVVRFDLLDDDGWLVMHVADSGIGISEEDQKHLFEPFHRGSNVGEVSGTGLGLAITKQAVELHGGTIRCHSVLGAGTTFTISFPIVLSDKEENHS